MGNARLKALGILLCVLAALFAVEAKVGWYSPHGSAAAHISAAKLQAAEAPGLVAKASTRTAPLVYVPEIAAALSIALVCAFLRISFLAQSHAPKDCPPGFYPSLFFRPPPVR